MSSGRIASACSLVLAATLACALWVPFRAHAQSPAPTSSSAETSQVRFTGEVYDGTVFDREVGHDLVFRLTPLAGDAAGGWVIEIVPKVQPADEPAEFLAIATPPYHFYNERYLAGAYVARPWRRSRACRQTRRAGRRFARRSDRARRPDATGRAAGALLCCNLLEHVEDPARLARHCLSLLPSGGLAFVTVPYSYPYHRDPIDTMFRPSPAELTGLFAGAQMVAGEIVGAGQSYRDEVRRRPWLLLRHAARFPAPFLSWTRWRRSMKKLYWLAAEYRITCAVFEKQ